MRSFALLLLPLALLIGASAAPTDCDPGFDFFVAPNATADCGLDCAYPEGWRKTNQNAAGNTVGKTLYSIAISTDPSGNPNMMFSFKPVWFALGAATTDNVIGCVQTSATAARKLMQGAATTTASVTQNGQISALQYKLNDNAAEVPGASIASDGVYGMSIAAGNGAYTIKINRDTLIPGWNKLVITYTVSNAQYKLSTDAADTLVTPKDAMVQVDIYYVQKGMDTASNDAKAVAEFAFSNPICTNTTALTLNASGIAPLAQPLRSNGTQVGNQYLFTPVITSWGKKLLEIDGTAAPDLLDKSKTDFVNNVRKYFIVPFTWPNNTVTTTGATKLQEGSYQVNATVAALSDTPNLVNFNGLSQIQQQDDPTVFQKWQSLTSLTTTQTVNVQYNPTYLSEISSNKLGSLTTGDKVVLKWSFRGLGTYKCYHDDVEVPACTSPYTLTVGDVGTTDKTHTFKVAFTDVCQGSGEAKWSYSQAGIQTVTQPNVPAALLGNAVNPNNNSALSVRSGYAAALATAAAAAVVLPMLL